MSDFDLPSIQIGRYIDLLKRRRWHIVPAAIVGLAVGLAVAWMIPRYYESETVMRLWPRAGFTPRAKLDPFLEEIRKARVVIKSEPLVDQVVTELGWTGPYENRLDDSYRAWIKEIIDRVEVYELDEGEPGRSSALLGLRYRDTDGRRSADFVNKLATHYVKDEIDGVIEIELETHKLLLGEVDQKSVEWANAVNQLKEWTRENQMDPHVVDAQGKTVRSERDKRLRELEAKVGALAADLAKDRTELEVLREEQKRFEKDLPQDLLDLPQTKEHLIPLLEIWQRHEARLEGLRPGSRDYPIVQGRVASARKAYEMMEQRLRKLVGGTKVNPAWELIQARIVLVRARLASHLAGQNVLGKQLEELRLWIKNWPDALSKLTKIQHRLESAKTELEQARSRLDQQSSQVAAIRGNQRQIIKHIRRAWEPNKPTYPNRALVAGLGGFIGLFVAIGLIFLLDVLRPSFKSYEDVSRGLPVPALGCVSYLEIEEKAAAARGKRVRWILAIGFVGILIAGIVVIYLVDPVRLPDFVRNLLDSIFPAASTD